MSGAPLGPAHNNGRKQNEKSLARTRLNHRRLSSSFNRPTSPGRLWSAPGRQVCKSLSSTSFPRSTKPCYPISLWESGTNSIPSGKMRLWRRGKCEFKSTTQAARRTRSSTTLDESIPLENLRGSWGWSLPYNEARTPSTSSSSDDVDQWHGLFFMF